MGLLQILDPDAIGSEEPSGRPLIVAQTDNKVVIIPCGDG
jgi:hypothetical protein